MLGDEVLVELPSSLLRRVALPLNKNFSSCSVVVFNHLLLEDTLRFFGIA